MTEVVNQPAFPCGEQTGTEPGYGMTLRDYFAAKAMQGAYHTWWTADSGIGFSEQDIAKRAYAMADEMMKVRSLTHD